VSDLLAPAADSLPKEKHIMDRVTDFLVYKGMKRAGAKGLAANWHRMYGDTKLTKALSDTERAANVGNYPAYMAAILKAEDAPETPTRDPVSNEDIRVPVLKTFTPPPWRDTPQIMREVRSMFGAWQQRHSDRLDGLSDQARWKAQRVFESKAWIAAQHTLMGTPQPVPDLTDEEWQDCIDRAASQGG
jgi:hypothetical protein